MLHSLLGATSTHSVNWTLIIGLSILIALPFISSTIIIPILLSIHKRKNKTRYAKLRRKTNTKHKKLKSNIKKHKHK
jgi:hypothetical protein